MSDNGLLILFLKELHDRYAGVWLRALAFLLDLTIMVLPVLPFSILVILVLLVTKIPLSDPLKELLKLFPIILSIIIATIYFTFKNSGKKQSTVGKMLCGIKIGNINDGSRISWLKAFLRILIPILMFELIRIATNTTDSAERMVLYLIFVFFVLENGIAFFSKEKATSHDYLLKIRVFKNELVSLSPVYLCFLVLIITLLWRAFVFLIKFEPPFILGWGILVLTILSNLVIIKTRHKENKLSLHEKKNLRRIGILTLPTVLLCAVIYSLAIYARVAG